MTAVILLAALAGVVLAGLGLAIPLTTSDQGRILSTDRLGLAGPLGLALTSGTLFAWSLAGGRLSTGFSWVLCGAGVVFGLAVVVREFRRRQTNGSAVPAACSPLARCCQVTVALLMIGAFVLTLMTPQRFWDERAIFGIKAKVLATDGTINSPSLRNPDFAQGHPRYPLLLPLAEAHVYLLLGRIDDRWSKGVFPLLFAGLVLTFAGVISRRFGAAFGWLVALLLATLPLLVPYELGFITGQGDAPVACYHGLTVLYVWDLLWRGEGGRGWSERSARNPELLRRGILIGVLAAAAVFTKDEGIAHLLVGAIALVMTWCWARLSARRSATAYPSRGSLFRLVATVGLTCAVLLTPWFLHRRTLPTTNEMQYFSRLSVDRLADQLGALHWLAPHLASRMFREWSTWGLQWWLLVIAAVTAPRRMLKPAQVFVLLEIAGSVAALIVAGMIAPAELHDHIGGSSHRYLMQLAPLAVLFAAGQWGVENEPTHEPAAVTS